jgi:imidazole glycerol-phosphate synthase subunit HisH
MMDVVVVDYGSGNLASASRALMLAAERGGIDANVAVTSDPRAVRNADRIVLPGQGAFPDCRRGLQAIAGLQEAIADATDQGVPFLGICVGMQLMAERGLEHTVTPGFGWVKGNVTEMEATGLRLPQMGWNALTVTNAEHPLVRGVETGDHVYFVHSYALSCGDPDQTVATTDYGGTVPAIVVAGNRAGTQFHVEKSQEVGIRLLTNFLQWTP